MSELIHFEKNYIKAKVLETRNSTAEPVIEATLFQGVPKGDKMDLIIQKSVELGITTIVPVLMARSVVKIENEKDGRKKQERWQRIAHEAAKQSGRGVVPRVLMPISFREALELAEPFDLKLIPYEKEEAVSIKAALKQGEGHREFERKSVGIMVGPEGGIDLSEVEKAQKKGFRPVTLGKRILRTETAGFVALSCVMYEFDEME